MHMLSRSFSGDCDVALIGAGPYGLSAAAHLKASGFGVRSFGEPMDFWADVALWRLTRMPLSIECGGLLRTRENVDEVS